jgi:hypothetical protein
MQIIFTPEFIVERPWNKGDEVWLPFFFLAFSIFFLQLRLRWPMMAMMDSVKLLWIFIWLLNGKAFGDGITGSEAYRLVESDNRAVDHFHIGDILIGGRGLGYWLALTINDAGTNKVEEMLLVLSHSIKFFCHFLSISSSLSWLSLWVLAHLCELFQLLRLSRLRLFGRRLGTVAGPHHVKCSGPGLFGDFIGVE